MRTSAWKELHEVVYQGAMVGGLSIVGVGLAVVLAAASVAHFLTDAPTSNGNCVAA